MVRGPDHEGCRSGLLHIKMPMFMSDRIFVNLYYTKENRDGSLEFVGSSQGNEEVVLQVTDTIKKNVVANLIVDY